MWTNLKQAIDLVIKTNDNQEITGAVLNSTLKAIVDIIGANATFVGIAIPSTNPGTPDGPIFYIASEAGTYSNFGGVVVSEGLSVLLWNGAEWSMVSILRVDDVPTVGSNNLVKSGGIGKVYGEYKENPEFIRIVTDNGGRILNSIYKDGSHYAYNLHSETIDALERAPGNKSFENIEDLEERIEILADSNKKIISYRKKDGTKVENIGLESPKVYTGSLKLTEEGMNDFQQALKNSGFQPAEDGNYIAPDLPKYGTINIKSETFYLNYDARVISSNDVYVIQDLEDSVENAAAQLTIAFYYIKSTLTDNGDGTYSKNANSVKLDFYAATNVTSVNSIYYVTSTLTKITDPVTGEVRYEVNQDSARVVQITDAPDVRTWPVDKKTEHYCVVDVSFGDYLTGTYYIGVKFQGASTLAYRKRNFRFTFYKNDSYAKKLKVKIGEMVRLSGFNLKANWTDTSRVKEMILYALLLEVWEHRPEADKYPWDKEFSYYTGATGFIKGFPVSTYIGDAFYGLQIFGLKKDEKNYMLDGDDDKSGIFVCGSSVKDDAWTNPDISSWEEEMMDEMSEETVDALSEFFEFINDRLDDGSGNIVHFNIRNIPDRMDVQGFIDYFINMQVFLMWDNTQRNMILHSRSDKKKFYPFFYDLDNSLTTYDYNSDIFDVARHGDGHGGWIYADMSFWRTLTDTFWDIIVNRYRALRVSVLNISYITQIFHALTDNIPDSDYQKENIRWGTTTSKTSFNNFLNKLERRFEWLDNEYFIY